MAISLRIEIICKDQWGMSTWKRARGGFWRTWWSSLHVSCMIVTCEYLHCENSYAIYFVHSSACLPIILRNKKFKEKNTRCWAKKYEVVMKRGSQELVQKYSLQSEQKWCLSSNFALKSNYKMNSICKTRIPPERCTLQGCSIVHWRASLVVQWLRIRLPMQGTRVRALVWEDPTYHRATGPVSHNYWACASGACAPQQERTRQWEARAPRWRVAPARRNWRKPSHRNEDPTQPKINK